VDEVHVFGDRLQWGIVPDLRRLCAPGATIGSHYGSTEAAGIGICSMMIGPDNEVGTGPIPLGRWSEPGRGRLEPVGDADGLAEIVAVGKTARGYWDDPAEEAVRFGRDPDGTRIVRTGDLARIDEQGMIHLVGRADDLVKIRGIRVEPAEAEAALTAVPGIREAVALAHDGARGARLVGHLVLDDDPTLTPESVRATLAGRLPPHLIPSPLVVHDALPLLPNRKIDRVALRGAPVTPWRTTPPRAPADDLEADVATLCAEVLELDHVGPDDDLWTLGLDSLAALALAAEVSELGWGPFDPSAPLRHVTAAAIADWLRTTSDDDDPYLPSEVIPLHPAPPGPGPTPIVALPGAGGTATAFFWLARALGPDRPVTVIEAHGLHTPGRPDRTIAAAARRTADLVDATHPTGPVVLLGHSAGGAIAHETAVLLHARSRDPHVVILDTILPAVLRARTPTAAPASPAAATPSPATRPRPFRPWRRIPRRLLDETRVRLRAAHPGPPSRSLTRFRAFTRIGERALRDYQPTPAPVPVLCLHVDHRIRDAWTGAVPDLTCVAVPGDHRSLLRPPHVNAVADHLHALATTLDRAPHPDATR